MFRVFFLFSCNSFFRSYNLIRLLLRWSLFFLIFGSSLGFCWSLYIYFGYRCLLATLLRILFFHYFLCCLLLWLRLLLFRTWLLGFNCFFCCSFINWALHNLLVLSWCLFINRCFWSFSWSLDCLLFVSSGGLFFTLIFFGCWLFDSFELILTRSISIVLFLLVCNFWKWAALFTVRSLNQMIFYLDNS